MPRHATPAARAVLITLLGLGTIVGPVIGPVPPVSRAAPAPVSTRDAPVATRAVVLDRPTVAPDEPATLRLPALGVAAPVDPVDVAADGSLGVPDDPRRVGWWRAGSRPGAPTGAVVLDGHVDTRRDGPGALFRLSELRRGDDVLLMSGPATMRYVVQDVTRHPKADLPPGIFASSGPPRLVLITCGGPFDRRTRQYADNTVVTATPG